MVANRHIRIHCRNYVRSKIPRMRSRKSHTANPWQLGRFDQQFAKTHFARRRIGVRIDGLAQKLHFAIAEIGELLELGQDATAIAAALGSARERHHAVSARLVAALDDGQISAPGIVAPGYLSLD